MSTLSLSTSVFQAAQHYSGVKLQQGRVQVDADLNENGSTVGEGATAPSHYTGVLLQQGTPQSDADVADAGATSPAQAPAAGDSLRAWAQAIAPIAAAHGNGATDTDASAHDRALVRHRRPD